MCSTVKHSALAGEEFFRSWSTYDTTFVTALIYSVSYINYENGQAIEFIELQQES